MIAFVITGPSGAGKGTILREVLKHDLDLRVSVSHTTRSPRPDEIDGREYHFVSREKFISMIGDGAFLEYATYNGNMYGTSYEAFRSALNSGGRVILEIECEGAEQVRKRLSSVATVVSIFIRTELGILRERLQKRGTDSLRVIDERIKLAGVELRREKEFDYIVDNDKTVECAADAVLSVIRSRSELAA